MVSRAGSRRSTGRDSQVSTAPRAVAWMSMAARLLADPEAATGGEAADTAHQDLHAGLERGRCRPGGLAVHQRVQRGIGQPELDRKVPPRPQVLDEVLRVGVDVFGREEGREAVFGDRFEEPVLVAEQPVDGRMAAGPPRPRPHAW